MAGWRGGGEGWKGGEMQDVEVKRRGSRGGEMQDVEVKRRASRGGEMQAWSWRASSGLMNDFKSAHNRLQFVSLAAKLMSACSGWALLCGERLVSRVKAEDFLESRETGSDDITW